MKRPILTVLSLALSLLLIACQDRTPTQPAVPQVAPIKVGISPNPLLGPLYAAQGKDAAWTARRFNTSGDIGYALLAGEIDAGFVETHKALKLLKAPGGETLKIAGSIQFPYGATVVVRKGLKLRLRELAGLRLAALDEHCEVKEQFERDAVKNGLTPKKLRYRYMPFSDMLPALEAKSIDAIVIKGAYAVLAERAGHTILYQKWDMAANGDDCCPPAIAQTEYFLVLRAQSAEKVKPLLSALKTTADLPPSAIRTATVQQLAYPADALEQYPTPTFALLNDEQVKLLGEARCLLTR
ncbi:hypothetical protein [Trichlorobacter ammonificans]|uniref:Uncharacterized protein n=1 Tax=Trichlorobacter ammonificans TaxID=2916410 RepID=A0ABM9D9S9_9BACT|nr:hypothetical protein [Trichlorobacter ammonificans]CAH2031983.1 conserved exported protein of unknown function [Trichlorobacter ammonificans]